jgi:iron(III) transport system substrate-binding protein
MKTLFLLLVALFCTPVDLLLAASPEEILDQLNKLSPAQRKAKLETEAAREGTVSWYSTYSLVEAEPFLKVFKSRHPKVEVQYFRASTTPLLDKLLNEYSAGRYLVDVIAVDFEAYSELEKAGIVGRNCSPERAFYGDTYKDKDCFWTAIYHNPQVIGYNTKKVAANDAPRKWEDLADAKWKGRLGIPFADGGQWVTSMLKIFGREKGMGLVKRMAEQKVQLHKSNSGLAQLIAAGDVDAGFMINVPAIGNVQRKGAPISSISPNPITTKINPLILAKHAPHPYASALLMDFILSKEGQDAINQISIRFSGRKDVKPLQPEVLEGVNVFHIGPGMLTVKEMDEGSQLFEQLFAKR